MNHDLVTDDLSDSLRYFFVRRFLVPRLISLSCECPPLMKEFTLPKAHWDIDTPGREPEERYAPCPRLYTLASCP